MEFTETPEGKDHPTVIPGAQAGHDFCQVCGLDKTLLLLEARRAYLDGDIEAGSFYALVLSGCDTHRRVMGAPIPAMKNDGQETNK